MASSTMINVEPSFDFGNFINQFSSNLIQQGYSVNNVNSNNGCRLKISKSATLFDKILNPSISANFSVNNGSLVINYTNVPWMSKILPIILAPFFGLLMLIPFIGWICGIPCAIASLVLGIIGLIRQFQFPGKIREEAMMYIGNSNGMNSVSSQYPGNCYQAQPAQQTFGASSGWTDQNGPSSIPMQNNPQMFNANGSSYAQNSYAAQCQPVNSGNDQMRNQIPQNLNPQIRQRNASAGIWACTCGRINEGGLFCPRCGSQHA